MDEIEGAVFGAPTPDLVRDILDLKRQVSALRRIAIPQRDVIGRLARREFTDISTEMAYRFRDVYDHIVRLNDQAMMLQDRITGVLEAHLSNVSNRLNQIMKVLTVVSTIFMPLTLLSGIFGMNVPLPHFPGGETLQFWWVVGVMIGLTAAMLTLFRAKRWL
jgi:magnesium transporter